jgi:GT2 family glycosyltransferase
MATHNRPEGLRKQLAALRAQTLPDEDYEVIVVDDGSEPAVVIDEPGVRVLRQEPSAGPAKARNRGWREAHAPLVAFTDDDCEATPGWLGSLLDAWEPGRFVQGPTLPDPTDAHTVGHFTHTLRVERLGPWWETANMLYPKEALEQAGGFDAEAFSHAGEDTDLGCRLIEAGYEPAWAPGALMHHAVTPITRAGRLRQARRWDSAMLNFKRHPHLREHLHARVFWIPNHLWLVRALVALALPKRLWWVRWWLAAPYVLRLGTPRPDVAAFVVVHDLVEMATVARGAIRYRTPVL